MKAWPTPSHTPNKEDPRVHYRDSTSPNPVATVSPTGYVLHVEDQDGKKSPPPEWYNPSESNPRVMRRSPSIGENVGFRTIKEKIE